MIEQFKGWYHYNYQTISSWNSQEMGVYYCGVQAPDGRFIAYYIGRAIGEGGIRGRLLQHLAENKWRDVTFFGYCICSSAKEAIDLEKTEIDRCKPKYNKHGLYHFTDPKIARFAEILSGSPRFGR